MDHIATVILGSIAFVVFWLLAVFPSIPFLPIGRTAGCLLGAMLMVIFGVLTPDEAYAAIDLQILGLLFGTMVVSIYLERADMFKYLGKLLSWKSKGPKDLICRVCLISAISSAFFTNDTACVVLTEFVLKIARQHNLPPRPFLLALASSANIGSSATPIGNPQNLVIAVQSKISFGEFVVRILPAMFVGVFVNASMILILYWKLLSDQKDEEDPSPQIDVSDEDVSSHRFSPARLSHSGEWPDSSTTNVVELQRSQSHSARISEASIVEGNDNQDWSSKWKSIGWKWCVYVVTLGMLVALLMGLNMSWTAVTAALALIVLDFKDALPSLEKVSYSLLVFFCGMFITIAGFNKTGLPSLFWNFMEPHAQINHVSGTAVLALVILYLSNFASNLPTVLLLGGRVAASAAAISSREEKRAWLLLAWISTVAGNLSLLGSAANLIVCEQARRTPQLSYNLSFWNHLKFGVPSTLIVTIIGVLLIR